MSEIVNSIGYFNDKDIKLVITEDKRISKYIQFRLYKRKKILFKNYYFKQRVTTLSHKGEKEYYLDLQLGKSYKEDTTDKIINFFGSSKQYNVEEHFNDLNLVVKDILHGHYEWRDVDYRRYKLQKLISIVEGKQIP
jgi:hypothetical protein